MKITGVETVRLGGFPNILWVVVHTDQGITGLGETYFHPAATEAHVHDVLAPYLIGKDPRQIEHHQLHFTGYLGFAGSGAETRARSAVDTALWDILGKSVDLPLCDVLGGRVRNDIKVYNTCAGYSYTRNNNLKGTQNFGIGKDEGKYDDLSAFLERADELAASLLEMGISAMKIWPFDYAAEATQGQYISLDELKKALVPFEKIRHAVGDKMEVMAELHSMWNKPMAIRIARALEPINPLWVEDPVVMDNMAEIADVAAATRCPIGVGETRGMRSDFRTLLEMKSLGLLIMDMSWCGGITEAKAIAASAQAYHLPVAFHDCTGPVVLTASTHLALNARNCFIQEVVRAFYYGWYSDVVTGLPPLAKGRITVPDAPGIGLSLLPDLHKRSDYSSRMTDKASL